MRYHVCGVMHRVSGTKKVQRSQRRRNVPKNDTGHDSCDALIDEDTKYTAGYLALSDLRNASFVETCSDWAAESVLTVMKENQMTRGRSTVKSNLFTLLDAIHLSAGVSGRGAEIRDLGIQTTSCKSH
eukprot:IDg6995t1